MTKCCTQDCNQGRLCPNKKRSIWTTGDILFTTVMLVITAAVGVSIMWWAITAVTMIVEAIK